MLGIAQDAGFPSPGCQRECCRNAWLDGRPTHYPASLAIEDGAGMRWLIDCTPSFPQQLALLDKVLPRVAGQQALEGIFLSHAHIGHYTGLMYLGREAIGSRALPVHVMPRMAHFLRANGPWSQLVEIGNIELVEISAGSRIELADGLWIEPMPVLHRAEYSETVAYRVCTKQSSLLFLPDIDRWEGLEPSLEELVRQNDYLLLDATFYSDDELPGRDMAEIPHPTVLDSLERLSALPKKLRARVNFFHFNHTNPLLDPDSDPSRKVLGQGYGRVAEGSVFNLPA